jgi:hypothetical protein
MECKSFFSCVQGGTITIGGSLEVNMYFFRAHKAFVSLFLLLFDCHLRLIASDYQRTSSEDLWRSRFVLEVLTADRLIASVVRCCVVSLCIML